MSARAMFQKHQSRVYNFARLQAISYTAYPGGVFHANSPANHLRLDYFCHLRGCSLGFFRVLSRIVRDCDAECLWMVALRDKKPPCLDRLRRRGTSRGIGSFGGHVGRAVHRFAGVAIGLCSAQPASPSPTIANASLPFMFSPIPKLQSL